MTAYGGNVKAELTLDTGPFSAAWKKVLQELNSTGTPSGPAKIQKEIDKIGTGIKKNATEAEAGSRRIENTLNSLASRVNFNRLPDNMQGAINKVYSVALAGAQKTDSVLNTIGARVNFTGISDKFHAAMTRISSSAQAGATSVKSSFSSMEMGMTGLLGTMGAMIGASTLFEHGMQKAVNKQMLQNMGKPGFYSGYEQYTIASSTPDDQINRMFQWLMLAPGLGDQDVYRGLAAIDAASYSSDSINRLRDQIAWGKYIQGGWDTAAGAMRDEPIPDSIKKKMQEAETPQERIALAEEYAKMRGTFGLSTMTEGELGNFNAALVAVDNLMRSLADAMKWLLGIIRPAIDWFNGLSDTTKDLIAKGILLTSVALGAIGVLKLFSSVLSPVTGLFKGLLGGKKKVDDMDVTADSVTVTAKDDVNVVDDEGGSTSGGILPIFGKGGAGGAGGLLARLGLSAGATGLSFATGAGIAGILGAGTQATGGFTLGSIGNWLKGYTGSGAIGDIQRTGIDSGVQMAGWFNPFNMLSGQSIWGGGGMEAYNLGMGASGNEGTTLLGNLLKQYNRVKSQIENNPITPLANTKATLSALGKAPQEAWEKAKRLVTGNPITGKANANVTGFNRVSPMWNSARSVVQNNPIIGRLGVTGNPAATVAALIGAAQRIANSNPIIVRLFTRNKGGLPFIGPPPAGPSVTDSFLSVASGAGGFRYESYGGSRQGILDTLSCQSGNCVDGTMAQLALAESWGIPAEMVMTTWRNQPHVHARIAGVDKDIANKAINNTWSAPPRGPGDGAAMAGVYIAPGAFVVKGPVYGVTDLEKQFITFCNKYLA